MGGAFTSVKMADGALDVTLHKDEFKLALESTAQHGRAVDTMRAFISEHMSNILKPFADHVDELHKVVDQLTADLTATATKASDNRTSIDQHSLQIARIRQDLHRHDEQLAEHQHAIDKEIADRRELEEDHGQTKAWLTDVAYRLHANEEAVHGLFPRIEVMEAQFPQLRFELNEQKDKMAARVEPTLEKLTRDLAKLDQQHNATAQLLEVTKEVGNDLRNQHLAHKEACEQVHRTHEKHIVHTNTTLAGFVPQMEDFTHRLKTQAEHTKSISTLVRPLKPRIDQAEKAYNELSFRHEGTARDLATLTRRYEGLNAMVAQFRDNVGDFDQAIKKGQTLCDVVGMLNKLVHANVRTIGTLEHLAGQMGDQLKKSDKKIGALDSSMQFLQKLMKSLEEKLGDDNTADGELGKHHMSSRLREALRRIDVLSVELERTNRLLQEKSIAIQGNSMRVKNLDNQLSCTNDKLCKVRESLALTQDYWTGLGKGFKETHKYIAVDNEMLPPKGLHTITLEALANTTSTVRTLASVTLHPKDTSRPSSAESPTAI